MVPKWLKIIRKSPIQKALDEAVDKILLGDLRDLDIKKIRGRFGMYRCRVGDYRILFEESSNGEYKIIDIGGRGDIYKNI